MGGQTFQSKKAHRLPICKLFANLCATLACLRRWLDDKPRE
ncbi:hypothetical protein RMSM_01999 [Rhodopirellula maiorica SM1]|uniref:Uncharacterized protein n=1 Tax=Rhodopirellula maiorica SM1 TaxID=1265738 RepID=M5S0A1_9BACT|nr:hypothetical protein RMSM_01999 [Rhodopirellula maiorica SM1]